MQLYSDTSVPRRVRLYQHEQSVAGGRSLSRRWESITAKTLDDGMGQLYVQVQDVEHKIIYPDVLAESKLRPWPWM